MEYRNFDLSVENKVGDSYQVRASSDRMGETDGLLTLSSDCLKLAEQLKDIENIVDANLPMSFGVTLHQCLFHENVADMLKMSLGDVLLDDEKGMRIRLAFSPPEISALPWEVLYDQRTKCFLATSGKTPLTRYINLFEPIKSLKITHPVKVLVLIPEFSGLDVDVEEKIVTEALKDLRTVELRIVKQRVTRSEISRALVEEQYHILHFVGHGRFESDQGYLEINSETGGRDLMSADAFADFFRHYPSLKLVVLNSCQGAEVSSNKALAGLAPQLVVRGIPAVVAMQYRISDEAALTFAREFYLKLCNGWNRGQVDAAVSHARNRIHMDVKEPMAFATPVLFMRSPTGVIFDFEQEAGIFRHLARLFISSPAKNVNRLREVKKTHETNILAWQEKTKDANPESLDEAAVAIAREKEEMAAIDDRIIGWKKTFLLSALATVVLFALGFVGLFNFPFHVDDWLESKLIPYMDRFITKSFSPAVQMILAEEGNNAGLGEPGPSWRQYHARLVEALAGKAKVIVFDLYLDEPTPFDMQLAAAIQHAQARGTTVIVGKAIDEGGITRKNVAEELQRVLGNQWGNIDVGGERGGFVRIYQLAQADKTGSTGNRPEGSEVSVIPSLALQAVVMFLANRPTAKSVFDEGKDRIQVLSNKELIRSIPVYKNAPSLLDFPYDLVERRKLNDATRSYEEVYNRLDDDAYLQEYVDKVVIVGFKGHDSFDVLQGEQRYGTEIHANVISNILGNVFVRLLPPLYDFVILAVMVGLGVLVRSRYRHVFSSRITLSGQDKKTIDLPGLLFTADLVYLLIAFVVYKNGLIYIVKYYHLVAPFIAYWLTGKVQRTAKLRAS